MAGAALTHLSPASAEEAAAALRETAAARLRGGGTKLGWGRPVAAEVELRTDRLDALVAHHAGDLTAVLQAGAPLARAQEVFAAHGQMLALDPPDGGGAGAGAGAGGATIGGVVASGDSGPLRHRYGAPRDLVLGVTVALPDGSVARAGSKVIKNVAGYDLAKLMSGACGTLGMLTEVTVRLHPIPQSTCTVVGRADDPAALARAATALTHLPLEADALDLRWDAAGATGAAGTSGAAGTAGTSGDGATSGAGGAPGAADGGGGGGAAAGAVLARFSGATARERAELAARSLREHRLACGTVDDDAALWAAQRAGQRGALVVRVSATQERLGPLLATARDHGAGLVARAAFGLAWLTLPAPAGAPADELAATVTRLRAALAPSPCVLLDAPAPLRTLVDPWGPVGAAQLALMRRVKERFDPHRRCNPGLYVGGI